jgi:hypothetical protein
MSTVEPGVTSSSVRGDNWRYRNGWAASFAARIRSMALSLLQADLPEKGPLKFAKAPVTGKVTVPRRGSPVKALTPVLPPWVTVTVAGKL